MGPRVVVVVVLWQVGLGGELWLDEVRHGRVTAVRGGTVWGFGGCWGEAVEELVGGDIIAGRGRDGEVGGGGEGWVGGVVGRRVVVALQGGFDEGVD